MHTSQARSVPQNTACSKHLGPSRSKGRGLTCFCFLIGLICVFVLGQHTEDLINETTVSPTGQQRCARPPAPMTSSAESHLLSFYLQPGMGVSGYVCAALDTPRENETPSVRPSIRRVK